MILAPGGGAGRHSGHPTHGRRLSGGRLPDPTYKRVCNEPAFGDYAEAIQLEFDPSIISYASVVEAFFGSHDFIANGRSRQYSSIIFAHDDAQRAAAEAALTARPRASTALEPFEGFWQAEPYHQKWLLQRKRELLLSLRLCDYDELTTSHAASVLNAVAAGRLSLQAAQNRLDGMLLKGEVEPEVHGSVTAMLDRL